MCNRVRRPVLLALGTLLLLCHGSARADDLSDQVTAYQQAVRDFQADVQRYEVEVAVHNLEAQDQRKQVANYNALPAHLRTQAEADRLNCWGATINARADRLNGERSRLQRRASELDDWRQRLLAQLAR